MANLPLFSTQDIKNKRVLVRVDLNVPTKDGRILDATRLEAIAPTLQALIKEGAKVVLLSHRGRPGGKADSSLSLECLVPFLKKILKAEIFFFPETIGPIPKKATEALQPGEILLLENLRFYPGEEKNEEVFSKSLSELGDVYINDAFAVSHRAHASVVGLPKYLPSFAGFLLQREIEQIASLFSEKAFPVMAIIGGSKISTKINLLMSLVGSVKTLAIGGGIANTFLAAQGHCVGNSLYEKGELKTAKKIMKLAQQKKCELIIPTDVKVARDLTANSEVHNISIEGLSPSESIFDIGIKTAEYIGEALERSKTVIWNGPLGLFEHQPFDRSSIQVAQNIAHLTRHGRLQSIAGGGETLAVLKRAQVANEFTYLSTGGGAFLEYIEGGTLPGLDALKKPYSHSKKVPV